LVVREYFDTFHGKDADRNSLACIVFHKVIP
jgi:hypothetical protein